MTDFKYIDGTAYGDDDPLDSFLLRRTHENLKATREKRGRLGVWAPGTINTSTNAIVKPQVSGYDERSLIPFLWHLAPNVSEIKVAVRHRVTTSHAASGYEVQLSAFAVEIDDFLSGRPLPAGQTSDLSGGASTSTTTTLTLDVSELSKGWIVVCVGALSGEAAAVQITKSSGTHGPEVYSGYTCMFHVCDHNADLGTTATVINHWGLLVEHETSGKLSDNIGKRQMLRYEYDNNASLSTDLTYRLYVYPQMPFHWDIVNEGSEVNALWYVELGVIDFESVTIYDSDVTHPDIGATLDASRPAGVRALIPRVGEQHELWLQNTRFHHLGPSQNPVDEDFSNNRPVNVISGSRSLTSTYRDICSCVVGRDDVFEAGGVNYRRLTYTLRALIIATYPTQDPGAPVPFDITLKLTLSDPDLSNTMNQELAIPSMACIRAPHMQFNQHASSMLQYGNNNAERYDSLAYLLGFGPQFGMDGFQRHTLRGVLPEGDMGRRNLYDVEINVLDTETTATRRIATLSAKRSDRTSDNKAIKIPNQAPRLHVLTWSVITTSHTDEVPATSLGS